MHGSYLIARSHVVACHHQLLHYHPALTRGLHDHVIVNGEEVPIAGNQTLLELLRQKATASRLGEQTSADEQPLVLVDGIAMTDGIGALTGIPAFHVERVSLLRETQAVPLYGSAPERARSLSLRSKGAVQRKRTEFQLTAYGFTKAREPTEGRRRALRALHKLQPFTVCAASVAKQRAA